MPTTLQIADALQRIINRLEIDVKSAMCREARNNSHFSDPLEKAVYKFRKEIFMDEPKNTGTVNEEVKDTGKVEPKSFEEQMAEVIAENKRMKRALDKASSEAADYKKQLMATKSETEKASIEKAEREAAVKERLEFLERKDKIREYADSFMDSGYSKDLAMKAAEALYDGKTDDVIAAQNQYKSEFEKKIKAEIMKTMPVPSTSNDDSIQMTQEQFDKLQYAERRELFEKHPSVYEKFVKR